MRLFKQKVSTREEQLQEIRELYNLSIQVHHRRRALGWNQAELAARARMTQSQIAQIEAGQINVTTRTLTKLAVALGCSVADLWLDEESCIAPLGAEAWRRHAMPRVEAIVIGSVEPGWTSGVPEPQRSNRVRLIVVEEGDGASEAVANSALAQSA